VLTLEYCTENGKGGNQNSCFFKGNQAAAHRRADTIGSIVGTNIPADIGPGSQQNEKYQFDGRLSSNIRYQVSGIRCQKDMPIGETAQLIRDFSYQIL
jgi:hypothetical protein